jgi:hypothetical protein
MLLRCRVWWKQDVQSPAGRAPAVRKVANREQTNYKFHNAPGSEDDAIDKRAEGWTLDRIIGRLKQVYGFAISKGGLSQFFSHRKDEIAKRRATLKAKKQRPQQRTNTARRRPSRAIPQPAPGVRCDNPQCPCRCYAAHDDAHLDDTMSDAAGDASPDTQGIVPPADLLPLMMQTVRELRPDMADQLTESAAPYARDYGDEWRWIAGPAEPTNDSAAPISVNVEGVTLFLLNGPDAA